MRLQLVREGQQYETRTGDIATVVEIFDSDSAFDVRYEQGGIISLMTLTAFRQQFHKLVKESYLIPESYDEDTTRVFNHGDIWESDEGLQYMVLRTVRSCKASIPLIPLFVEEAFPEYGHESITNTKEVKLIRQITFNEPVSKFAPLVMTSNSDIAMIEKFNTNSVKLQERREYGFGKILSYREDYSEIPEFESLETCLFGAQDLQDPDVGRLLHQVEYIITVDRWRF